MQKDLGCAKLEIALGRVWSTGKERLSFPSTLPWGDCNWSAVSSSEVPSPKNMRNFWSGPAEGKKDDCGTRAPHL